MVEKVMVVVPAAFPAAEIVAVEVSAEGYMDKYAAEFHEWVKGVLHYLIMLLEACADICIEIVSPESVTRDYGDKFVEYEKAGYRNTGSSTRTGQAAILSCMCRLSGRMNCPKQARSRRPSKKCLLRTLYEALRLECEWNSSRL